MAVESSTAAGGGRSGSGGASADSYIGSLISLTSKSEIRYEGILYNINTDESSIGLRNVRSFGTEGRKKDGPQVPPSDKIYEYILFRGSDIKDLQVKASPPVQTALPINSDPAIIQSHYPHPTARPTSLPAAPIAPRLEHGQTSAQMGISGSAFQNGLPLYQLGGNSNSWGPIPPPNANASGLAMPMYWQGFYGTPGGLPQLPQQSLLRPPPGLSIPSTMEQMQFPAFSSSLPVTIPGLPSSIIPGHHVSAVPNFASSSGSTSTSLPAPAVSVNVPPLQTGSLATETISKPPNHVPSSSMSISTSSSNLPPFAQVPISVPDHAGIPSIAVKTVVIPGPVTVAQQSVLQPRKAANGGPSGSVLLDTPAGHPIGVKTVAIPVPVTSTQHSVSQPRKAASAGSSSFVHLETSLVTPGQLLQQTPASASTSQLLQTAQKDVEVVQVSPKQLSEPSVALEREGKPPMLSLPPNTRTHKANGGAAHMQNYYRGRGGRGYGASRPVTKFVEDFDFTAMNEKFKKDEVWGCLGKGTESQFKDDERGGSDNEEEDRQQDVNDTEMLKIEVKPVYNKDDFFDTLSGNAMNNDPNHGRTRYAEQIKLDTETFGEFSRYQGGRGGGRSHRSYYGRGGYGGYDYMNRGRGRGVQTRTS